jgi:hypothetical protein
MAYDIVLSPAALIISQLLLHASAARYSMCSTSTFAKLIVNARVG